MSRIGVDKFTKKLHNNMVKTSIISLFQVVLFCSTSFYGMLRDFITYA